MVIKNVSIYRIHEGVSRKDCLCLFLIDSVKKMMIWKEENVLYFKSSDLYNLRIELIKHNVYLKEMNEGSGISDLKLNLDINLYGYQKEAVKRFIAKDDKNRIKGRGLMIMPPGSGKTMVALKIIEKLKVKTLIIVLKKACYEIWLNEIINNTNYKEL